MGVGSTLDFPSPSLFPLSLSLRLYRHGTLSLSSRYLYFCLHLSPSFPPSPSPLSHSFLSLSLSSFILIFPVYLSIRFYVTPSLSPPLSLSLPLFVCPSIRLSPSLHSLSISPFLSLLSSLSPSPTSSLSLSYSYRGPSVLRSTVGTPSQISVSTPGLQTGVGTTCPPWGLIRVGRTSSDPLPTRIGLIEAECLTQALSRTGLPELDTIVPQEFREL